MKTAIAASPNGRRPLYVFRLEDALLQALDRMETMWNHMNPDTTEDDRHAIAQNCWFGMEELRAVIDGERVA